MAIINRQELAKKFGVTIATINNYQIKGLPVHHKDPGDKGSFWFDEEACQEWYIDNIETDEMHDVDLRKKTADAVLAELKVLKANYQSINTHLVLDIYKEQCGNISSSLKSLITVIAAKIPDISTYAERTDLIETEILNTLKLLTVGENSLDDWEKIARDADFSKDG